MANENRLIDANAFKMFLEVVRQDYLEEDTLSSDFAAQVIETVQDEYLANAPTVDAVEVVHGRWLYNGRTDNYYCSNCFKQPISFRREMDCGVGEFVEVCFSDYCPNCGAKMDGGNEDGNNN